MPEMNPLVLVVDDDPLFRALVVALLARITLAVVECGSGREAVEIAREQRPSLVVLDVVLPDVNGFEICRELRDELGEDLPIVFLSGARTEPLDRSAGLLLGADDYVTKPFEPDELIARLRRHLARSRRPAAPTAAASFQLTEREQEVLRLLAEGMRPSQISAELVISRKTVDSHVQRVLTKLGVHSRAEAVAAAYRLGLVAVPSSGNGATVGAR